MFLVITVNTAHLRRWVTKSKKSFFPPPSVDNFKQNSSCVCVCVEERGTLLLVCGIRNEKEKKKSCFVPSPCRINTVDHHDPNKEFIHSSTCMSRQHSLPMNVADALQKKVLFSQLDSCFIFFGFFLFCFVLDWHVLLSTVSAQFLSHLFPNGYLLKCNFNKVHIFPWTLYTAAT